MKKILFLALALALAGGGWRYYSRKAQAREDEAKDNGVIAVRAVREDMRITVSASGRVVPEREVEIKSKASGEVVKVYADVSDEVELGKLLFQLDPTDEERAVAKLSASLAMSRAKLEQVKLGVKAAEAKLAADRTRAEADLKSAEAEKEEFEARLGRSRRLFEQKVVTREELDAAVTKAVQTESALANARVKLDDLAVQEMELERTRREIPVAEAQVETDLVTLDEARQRLRDTNIHAPITGVVSERSVQEGFIVASGVSNVGGGTTTMKLIDLSRIYAIAAVDEADIRGIVPGVKAVITADAFKGMEFSGAVVRVAATGVVESNVVTFDVKVEVEGRGRRLLKPEMTTNITFMVDGRDGAIVVPSAAVVRKAVTEAAPAAGRPGAGTREGGRETGGEQARDGERRVDYSRRQAYVSVRTADGSPEERKVETGITDGYQIEIVSGLGEGETVLYRRDADGGRWAGQAGHGGPGGRRPPM